MKKYTQIMMFLMVPLFILRSIDDLEASRGGAIAGSVLGGFALGTIVGSAAASRNAYASNEDYINALEQENADLRAELGLMKRRCARTYAR